MPVATKVVCHGIQGMTGCISVCCKVCSFATVHESVNVSSICKYGSNELTRCMVMCCKVCSFDTVHESVNFEEQVVSKVSKVNALT